MRSWLFVLSLLACLPLAAAEPVRLTTDIMPPYQVREGDQLAGSSVDALDCIFRALERNYEIRVFPWERAMHEVAAQRADAFFSATRMARANHFATLSAPLALEKWYWYSNVPVAPRHLLSGSQPLRIGGLRGSNQVAWLHEHGVKITVQVNTTRQLLQLLAAGRIDAFVADQSTLNIELTHLPTDMRPAHEHFLQYSTLGVYFGHHFLQQETDFLPLFNAEIHGCIGEINSLSPEERQHIARQFAQHFAHWVELPDIIAAVQAQNSQHEGISQTDINRLDQQWMNETALREQPLIQSVLERPLSRWLQTRQGLSARLISEIIITDRHGLNVAVSEITTDYWQGDEAKFQRAFFSKDSRPFLGVLEYDQSSQRYHVHFSSQILDPQSGEVIGVMVIGLDIGKALRQLNQNRSWTGTVDHAISR
ncbi:transporter substrate-binding domain-containing protein [Halopseudomonas salegens]|nr:transporter substrate-binding domain-containing protein [Halopseudomonas salegens]